LREYSPRRRSGAATTKRRAALPTLWSSSHQGRGADREMDVTGIGHPERTFPFISGRPAVI